MRKSRIASLAALGMLLASTVAHAAPMEAGGEPGQVAPRLQTLAGAYLAAKSAQFEGNLDAATDYFDQALELDPDSPLLQQDAMFAFLAHGRFVDGVDLAERLRGSTDAGKVARITVGVDALNRGDYDAALREFDITNPSDLDALLLAHLSAWAEAGANRTDAALQRLEELDGAAWYPIFNHYQAGLIASLAGQTEAARASFQEILGDLGSAQTSPDAFLAAAEALARLEARAGNKAAAIEALEKGLELAESYDPLIQLKEQVEAGEPLEPAVSSAKQGAAETFYILGQAINRGEGQQVALLYFQLARVLAPENARLLTALAGIAERSGHFDLAISYYEQVPQNSVLRRGADLQRGLDLWYAERKDEAKAHLKQLTEAYPQDLEAHLALADVLAGDEDFAGAAAALDKAAEIAEPNERSNWNLFYQRGIAYERLKQWPKAEPNFRKALELAPNQPQVLNYLGYSWVDMNLNLQEGLEMIKTAVELRPNDGYIIDSLGWAYYRLGRFEEAVEQLERAVLLSPVDATMNDHLGDAYWRVGREREARFQWERALVAEPKPEPDRIAAIQEKLKNGLEPVPGEAAAQSAGTATPSPGASSPTVLPADPSAQPAPAAAAPADPAAAPAPAPAAVPGTPVN